MAPSPATAAAMPQTQTFLPPAAPPPRAVPDMGPAPTPAPTKSKMPLIVGGGVVVLAAVAFGAYSLLTPAPRPAQAPVVITAPPPAAPAPAPAPVAEAPVPAPAPAATTGLDPLREFDRVVQGQTAGFGVQAQADKTTLKIGRDEIGFTVQSERDGFLYVFIDDGHGTLLQLLPNSVSGGVRVRKGQRFHFPTGDGVVLPVGDPPGPGQLLVMVSTRQRDHRDLEPRKEGSWRMFPVGNDAAAIVARHTGPQPLLAGKPICPATGACEPDYGAALIKVDVVK
jgi:hypothetical protein